MICLAFALSLLAGAMVLPSHREPGCPVVVSNICGCVPELVLESITGFSDTVGDARRNSIVERPSFGVYAMHGTG